MLPMVFAFVLGGAAGYFYGRWRPATTAHDATPAAAPAAAPAPDGRPPVLAKPNKRGRKAGLTEADFTPSDDILEKLRLAEAGELDPALLQEDAESPARPEATPSPEPVIDPLTMTEAERRVFERLRRMEEGTEEEATPPE